MTGNGNDHRSLTGGRLMAWMEKLHQAQAELAERNTNSLRGEVEAIVRGVEAISTVALLDLLGLPKTTGNGRRISPDYALVGIYSN